MKHNKTYSVLLFTYFLNGCAWTSIPPAYIPGPQVTPNFGGKNDALVALNVGLDELSFLNIYGAKAITEKYQASIFISRHNQDPCPTCAINVYNIFEIGGGPYFPEKNYSFIGGIGKGNLKHFAIKGCSGFSVCDSGPEDQFTVKSDFIRFFLQGNYWGSNADDAEMPQKGISMRLSYIQYFDFLEYNRARTHLFQKDAMTAIFLEPNILIRKNFYRTFTGIQIGFAIPLKVEKDLGYFFFYTSVELGLRFP